MKRNTCLATAATSAVLTMATVPGTAVAASGPDRVTVDISESQTSASLSEACGTEVVVTVSGTQEITLWRNEEGLVVRELDRTPGAFITWSAPETGQSTKTRADLVSTWDYGDGAVLGGPVTFEFHGMRFHLPGSGTGTYAWREVSEGDVDGFDPGGVPAVDDGTLVSLVGHVPEDFDFAEAVCGLLT
jgi:hypothetical protein